MSKFYGPGAWSHSYFSRYVKVVVILKPQSHFRQFFTQKWDYSGDSRQFISRCLGRYRPLFSMANQFCAHRANKSSFFCVDGWFLQLKVWNSRWKYWATLEHRLTISRQFMSVVGRSTFRYLECSEREGKRERGGSDFGRW